jgi:RND family efflux transporter MFP subunit
MASPAEAPAQEQEVQTAPVRRGDLIIYASGSGTLLPADVISLGFGATGEVEALLVDAGVVVDAGDVLAQQADVDQLELEVVEAELALLDAKAAFEDLRNDAALVSAQALIDLGDAQEALAKAERTWSVQQEGNRASSSTLQAAEAELNQAQDQMRHEEERAHDCGSSSDSDCAQAYKNYAAAVQRFNSALASYNWYTGHPTEAQQMQLDGELALAQAQAVEAERHYASVKDGADPEEITRAEISLAIAETNLAVAENNLARATLTAPTTGTILTVSADVGETVDAPFLTMADLSAMYLEIQLDESDLDKVQVGYEVEVVFDALPDETFSGQIVQVDPSLSSSGQISTLQAMALIDVSPADLSNAAVDVIAGRAEDAILVPTEALRELTPEKYAVFVMEDGTLTLRPIEVGIMNFTLAQVLSGLQVGEMVTTGIVETQ